jgi:hypothetical protein
MSPSRGLGDVYKRQPNYDDRTIGGMKRAAKANFRHVEVAAAGMTVKL